MKSKSKPFLIAIAAFAVTATGVQAFQGTEILQKAGLTEEQIEAFETARELRESGDKKAASDALLEAGIDDKAIESVHKAMHEVRDAIHDAVEANDYDTFKAAVAGTPLAEAVDTEDDFKKFVDAHNLKEEGEWEEAKAILDELGIEPPHRMPGMGHGRGMMPKPDFLEALTDEQRDALRAARQANDKEAVRAILEEAGVERGGHHFGRNR
jgi:Spy/CpxP family protein refolding chaperone